MKQLGIYRKLWTGGGPPGLLAAVCLILLVVYLPTFSNPPHGDYWEAFHQFHHAGDSCRPGRLLSIINHDPWQDGTFRPFSYLLLYLVHRLFGGSFVWNHLINFFLYCLSVFLLYLLAVRLSIGRLPAAVFLAVFIFLFTHSGILTLTFHKFLIAGFSVFLAGFIFYLRGLETGRLRLLAASGLLFLAGMFCYEAFVFWPPAIVFLRRPRRDRPAAPAEGVREISRRCDAVLLVLLYLAYLAVFLLTRTASVTTGSLPGITAGGIGLSLSAAFFNLAYNGIVLNLFPFLVLPCPIVDWVEMGSPIAVIAGDALPAWLAWGGIATMALVTGGGWLLYRRKEPAGLFTLIFLLYLYLANFFTVFLGRIPLGNLNHILIQFRYQYAPNALLVLMGAAVIGSLPPPGKIGRVIAGGLLLWVLAVNIAVSCQVASEINRHLLPLKRLLNRVRAGMESGEINPRDRIYIYRSVTAYLPELCWQKGIGRNLPGSYEWVFSPTRIDRFAFSRREAAWILDSPLGTYRRKENESQ